MASRLLAKLKSGRRVCRGLCVLARSIHKKDGINMVDTSRSGFPREMDRIAHPEMEGTVERVAVDVVDTVTRFAREKPIPALFSALGIGFFLGWRLKPW